MMGDIVDSLILAIDVGTTSVRAQLRSHDGSVLKSSSHQIDLSYPQQDCVELDPDQLWKATLHVVKACLQDVNIRYVKCLGLTAFRASFITWDRDTGESFHPFIMWQDNRTKNECERWNKSLTLRSLNIGSGLLYSVTRSQRFKAGSIIKFMTFTVPLRLKMMLDTVPKLKQRLVQEKVCFGTVDTWLVWKLTGERVWVTDYSAASSTLLYDTYQGCWSGLILKVVGIPAHILPPIVNTSCKIGTCDDKLFGAPIPITCMVADQQSSTFGHCQLEAGCTKVTLGTGSFIDINIGDAPLASLDGMEYLNGNRLYFEDDSIFGYCGATGIGASGIYSIVGWVIDDKFTYLAESNSKSNGSCVNWLKSIGLINSIAQCDDIARGVEDSNGVVFVPAFNGLPPPINDDSACGAFIGLSSEVTKSHMTRACLESLAFAVKMQHDLICAESNTEPKSIRIDGGVSQNGFIVQLIADLLNKPVSVSLDHDVTIRGAAMLAGLGAGIWKDIEEMRKSFDQNLRYQILEPRSDHRASSLKAYDKWLKATDRVRNWHQNC